MPSGWERIEGMEGLHASDGTGDHGYSIGRHERDIVGCPPQSKGVVRRAGRAQDVVGPERFQVMVRVMLRVLHLQRHDLFFLAVCKVIGRPAPLRRQPVAPHFVSLVPFVVECGEGKNVEEEKGCADGYGDAEFGGVVPSVEGEQVLMRAFGSLWFKIGGECGVRVAGCAWAGCSGPSTGAWA